MSYPQPYFHGLTVKATWDGEIRHAVDLYITFGVDAIPTSRLRLISLEAATHADMTGVNENSPATTYAGDALTGVAPEGQEVGAESDGKTPGVMTDLTLDSPFQSIHASRIPLPMSSSRPASPQKRPLPPAQRPRWRWPPFEDVTQSRPTSPRAEASKSMTAHSADGSCSPPKLGSENVKGFDATKRGRDLLRAELSQRASHDALSGPRTAEGTPEQKVAEWLDQSEPAPIHAPLVIPTYGPQHPGYEQRRMAASAVDDDDDDDDEEEQFPASPTPSSQAIVPWTSVRYRNPLRLRGAGSCAASLEKFNGCLYAVFPPDVMPVVHRVQLRAQVHLRKDAENGGHLLELPGLPRQDHTQACFTLSIVGDQEGEYPAHTKIAHVDKDFGTDVFTGPQMDLTFDADAPFSVKFLCFEDGVQVLTEADFETVYDVQTIFDRRALGAATQDAISCKHLLLCSLRLRDFLIWADHLQVTIFIPDVQVSVLRTKSVTAGHEIRLGDRRPHGNEREVTVTMKAADVTKPFGFVFEGTLKASAMQYWLPRIYKASQLAHDIRLQQEDHFAFEDLGLERPEAAPAPELVISDVVSTGQIADRDPVRTASSHRPAPNPPVRTGRRWCRTTGYVVKLVFVAYLLAYYVITRFGLDRQSVDDAARMVVARGTRLAAQVRELAPGHRIDVDQAVHPHVDAPADEEPSLRMEEEMCAQNAGDPDEPDRERGAYPLPLQGWSVRDRIDRALGWKGPKGDW